MVAYIVTPKIHQFWQKINIKRGRKLKKRDAANSITLK